LTQARLIGKPRHVDRLARGGKMRQPCVRHSPGGRARAARAARQELSQQLARRIRIDQRGEIRIGQIAEGQIALARAARRERECECEERQGTGRHSGDHYI
jgi:demethoxyubiquinone hydroxylase (CLK1/Coq7/Cat5 family)